MPGEIILPKGEAPTTSQNVFRAFDIISLVGGELIQIANVLFSRPDREKAEKFGKYLQREISRIKDDSERTHEAFVVVTNTDRKPN